MTVADVFNPITQKWVSYVKVGGVGHHTLSGRRWNNLLGRCDPNGAYHKMYPQYAGCTNAFTDFQEFVFWSREQIGYSDSRYELDKDILVPENKIYSVHTCAFVPRELNNLFRYKTISERSKKNRKIKILQWISCVQSGEIQLDTRILNALQTHKILNME